MGAPPESLDVDETSYRHPEAFGAAQEIKFDHKTTADNHSSELFHQLYRGLGRTSGRQEVIDDKNTLSGFYRVAVDL